MGRTHALTGWCAGLALAPAVGAGSVHQAVVFAATTAGFALLPDLDHPHARASRLLGWFTGMISWLLRRVSAAVYALTKGPRDEKVTGQHRHLSHTVLFAAGLGAATSAGTTAGGPWAVFGVVVLGLLLAEGALGDWLLPVSGVAVAWWVYTAPPDHAAQLEEISGWLGLAVAAGCFAHCLGDALTESGCPFLFPIPIAGETWYEIRPPRPLRFRTGKKVENRLIFPVFVVLAVLLVPGVWNYATDTAHRLFTPPTSQSATP
ncbi:metal-dependent hydrolase [Amycolatopsis sp. H20-H5]|uniref:metal-dependent hydrolase n=1 Tax=Amycolatopsis sp. H20-H5 TaxID=3046309 RepID=UPI002DBDB8D2|nr:metal-dependent hydrolase [Amycolatopsis sp. H20-H5]MEC3978852.1 metal-dependent hydrolase [Amycolatopsis sp. H20-H5]